MLCVMYIDNSMHTIVIVVDTNTKNTNTNNTNNTNTSTSYYNYNTTSPPCSVLQLQLCTTTYYMQHHAHAVEQPSVDQPMPSCVRVAVICRLLVVWSSPHQQIRAKTHDCRYCNRLPE